MKRAMAGKLALLPAIKRVMDEVMAPPSFDGAGETGSAFSTANSCGAGRRSKRLRCYAAGVASQRFITGLEEQQEIMADLADMIAQIYALESALLRAQKLAATGRKPGNIGRSHDGPARQ